MRSRPGEVKAFTPPLLGSTPSLHEVLDTQPVGLPAVRRGRGQLARRVQAQELTAFVDAPLHAGQVARVAVLLLLADAGLEALALGGGGLLRRGRLVGLLGLFPGVPVFALQLVE